MFRAAIEVPPVLGPVVVAVAVAVAIAGAAYPMRRSLSLEPAAALREV